MKILILSVCALWVTVSGSAVAWPGGVAVSSSSVYRSIAPPQTKIFGLTTTQYINGVPGAVPLQLQPQVTYEIPHYTSFAPVHQTFFPVSGATYYPGTVFYPSLSPAAPVVPGFPQAPLPNPSQPTPPQQDTQNPPGDADTAVVDSADFPQQQEQEKQPMSTSTEAPQQQQNQPSEPQLPPSNNFPTFPGLPQIPQQIIPSYPSLPQFPQGIEFPSFPSLPQFPQGSVPSFPQLPQFPSNEPQQPSTPAPPASFPGSANDDKGLNDEDTVSVDSA